jgi:hypothetical protein
MSDTITPVIGKPQFVIRVKCPRTATEPTIDDVTLTRHRVIAWRTPPVGVMEPVATSPRADDETDYLELPGGQFEQYGIITFDDIEYCKANELKYAWRDWFYMNRDRSSR